MEGGDSKCFILLNNQKKMRNLSIKNFFKFFFCFFFLPTLYKTSGFLILTLLPRPPWAGGGHSWVVRWGNVGWAGYSGISTCRGAAHWPLGGDTRKQGTSQAVTVGLDTGHHFTRPWIWFQGPGRSPKSFEESTHLGKLTMDVTEDGLEAGQQGSGRGVQVRARGIRPKAKGKEGSHSETVKRD